MKRRIFDLHMHTYWSYDAFSEPEDYFRAASEYGTEYIAITEHHNLDSQTDIQEIAAKYPGVSCIRAAELSVQTSIGAVDLVCLGFPGKLPEEIVEIMEEYHRWQHEYGAAFTRATRESGFSYTEEDRKKLLESYRPEKVFAVQGNTHVRHGTQREYFIRRGFARDEKTVNELYRKIKNSSLLPKYPAAEKITPILKKYGIIISIAHPYGYFQGFNIDRIELLASECHLDGIECAHPSVPSEFTGKYRNYCIDNEMISTAGTDCHSREDIADKFAVHLGEKRWLGELLERLPKSGG